MNKSLIIFFSGLSLLASSHALAAPDKNISKPNIVMLLVDDFGRQDIGIYGSSFYETPNIDQLASEGMRFDNAYVAHPRCVPSRVAIFSGSYPTRYGVPQGNRVGKHQLPLSAVTFGEHLKDAGYQTGYIGKWHLGKQGGEPTKQGFDTSIMAGHWGAPPSYYYPYTKMNKAGDNKGFPKVAGKKGEYLTDRLTDEAVNFIEQKKDKPFLLVLAHYAVHTPIEGKPALVEKYKAKMEKLGIADAGPKSDADLVKDTTGYHKTIQNNPDYAAMVESVDISVGRIEAKLAKLGLDDNTIIILTSDHGGLSSRGLKSKRQLATSNEPYRHGKGWIYDGGTRVPLIVKWPGKVKAGSISNVQVTGTDHYPTILQMAGLSLAPQDHKDGVSYLEALNNNETPRKAMFWHSPAARPGKTGDTNSSAIIEGDWKLLDFWSEGRIELYNLKNDKSESKNLVNVMPEKTTEMLIKLNKWKSDIHAHTVKKKNKKANPH
jgi:arylsulfatase A-like enzyme